MAMSVPQAGFASMMRQGAKVCGERILDVSEASDMHTFSSSKLRQRDIFAAV
jgi:hypothetical protein